MFVLIKVNITPVNGGFGIPRLIHAVEQAIHTIDSLLSHSIIHGNFEKTINNSSEEDEIHFPGSVSINKKTDNETTLRETLARLRTLLGFLRTEEPFWYEVQNETKKSLARSADLAKSA